MECERIDDLNREQVNRFIQQHWYTIIMIIRGKEIDMTQTEGFFFRDGETIVGLITYMLYDDTLEIVSLDSLREGQGIGSRLVELVVQEAQARGLKKVLLITTNDNINAIITAVEKNEILFNTAAQSAAEAAEAAWRLDFIESAPRFARQRAKGPLVENQFYWFSTALTISDFIKNEDLIWPGSSVTRWMLPES